MALITSLRWQVRGDVTRCLGVGIVSGTLAGLVVGVCARLVMRIVALGIALTPGFSIEGTLNILLMGMFVGVTPGIGYAVIGRRLPGPPVLRGLTFGVMLFVVLGVYPLVSMASVSEPAIHPLWVRWAVFGALSIVYGLALGATEPWVDRTLPAPWDDRLHIGAYVVLAVWGLATTAMFLAAVAGAEFGIGPIR